MPKELTLLLDDHDYDAVQRAIAKRQTFMCWPDAVSDMDEDCLPTTAESNPLKDGSNLAGLAVAEICRGWLELLELEDND